MHSFIHPWSKDDADNNGDYVVVVDDDDDDDDNAISPKPKPAHAHVPKKNYTGRRGAVRIHCRKHTPQQTCNAGHNNYVGPHEQRSTSACVRTPVRMIVCRAMTSPKRQQNMSSVTK